MGIKSIRILMIDEYETIKQLAQKYGIDFRKNQLRSE